MPNEIEHHYAELKKKHALPDFALVDKEFEISTIEKPHFLLRHVRHKIADCLDDVTNLLDPLIQPDAGSYVNLTEYRALTEADRRSVMKILQHIRELRLACADAGLSADDVQDAKLISRASAEWPHLREALRPLVQKVAAGWAKPSDHQDNVGYFG